MLCSLLSKRRLPNIKQKNDILKCSSTRNPLKTMQKGLPRKKAVFRCEKQSSIFKKVIQAIEGGYKVAEGIAEYGKPFADEVFAKEAFPSCAKVLFDDLPNKCTIILRINDVLVSPRTVNSIKDMATKGVARKKLGGSQILELLM